MVDGLFGRTLYTIFLLSLLFFVLLRLQLSYTMFCSHSFGAAQKNFVR